MRAKLVRNPRRDGSEKLHPARLVAPALCPESEKTGDARIQSAQESLTRRREAVRPFPKPGMTEVHDCHVDAVWHDRTHGVNEIR
jgi:hypothetical protein